MDGFERFRDLLIGERRKVETAQSRAVREAQKLHQERIRERIEHLPAAAGVLIELEPQHACQKAEILGGAPHESSHQAFAFVFRVVHGHRFGVLGGKKKPEAGSTRAAGPPLGGYIRERAWIRQNGAQPVVRGEKQEVFRRAFLGDPDLLAASQLELEIPTRKDRETMKRETRELTRPRLQAHVAAPDSVFFGSDRAGIRQSPLPLRSQAVFERKGPSFRGSLEQIRMMLRGDRGLQCVLRCNVGRVRLQMKNLASSRHGHGL
ncbi:MAG: hypothetical protein AAFM92_10435 [Pseudomonadota bacterium]